MKRASSGMLYFLNIILVATLLVGPLAGVATAVANQPVQVESPTEAGLDLPMADKAAMPDLAVAADAHEAAMNEVLADAGLAGVARLEPFGGQTAVSMPAVNLPVTAVNPPAAPNPFAQLQTGQPQAADLAALPQPEGESEPLDFGGEAAVVRSVAKAEKVMGGGTAVAAPENLSLPVYGPKPPSIATTNLQSPVYIYLPIIAHNTTGAPPPPEPEPIPNQITVTPDNGGVLTTMDGILELMIPPGAVTTTTTIAYESLLGTPVPGNRETYGAYFDLTAQTQDGTPVIQFQKSLTLTIHYPETVFSGVEESRGFVGYWHTAQALWIPLATSMQLEANIAVATTDHFTSFALLLLPDCGDIDWTPIPGSIQSAFEEACFRVGLGALGNYIGSGPLDDTWVAHFDNGWLVYNTGLGMAYFLATDIYDVYPAAISWLGMPTSDTDPNGPPDTYRDAYHDFRGQPYNLFDNGFIGITNGVAEAHLNYPQILNVATHSENLGDGTVTFSVLASVDPSPGTAGPTAYATLVAEFGDGTNWYREEVVGPSSLQFTYPNPVPITETITFHWILDRVVYSTTDDLVGYAPCLYYDHQQPYGPLSVVSNFQAEVGCEGDGGGGGTGDYLPPTIQLIEVWPDGQGNLSIKVKITDNSGTVASYSLTNDIGNLSTPLTPTPQFGADVYSAIISHIPTNQVVHFTVTATDPAGNTASISANSRSPFFRHLGLSCVNPCGWDRPIGNPVVPGTGNKVEQVEALTVAGAGGSDIEIILTYNSQDSRIGIVGQGWRFPYQMDMRLVNNLLLSGAEVNYADGRKILFTDNDDGTYSPQTPDIHDQLWQSGSHFILKKKSLAEYEFDGDGRLIAMRDRNGNEIEFIYTGDQLTRIQNDAGRWVNIAYNGDGFIETLTAPEGRQIEFAYDGNKLVGFTNGRDHTWQYEYEERYLGTLVNVAGQVYEAYDYLLTGVITPKGHYKNEQSYDATGRVVEQWAGENERRTFVYDDEAHTVTITDMFNHTTVYHYDDDKRLVLIEYANGTSEAFDYDDDFNRIYRRDQEGREWHWTYDDQGNRLTETGPLDWQQAWAYNDLNRVISQTTKIENGRFRTTLYGYDPLGNLTHITDTLGYTSTIQYDPRGLPERMVDFNGNLTINEYDPVTGDLTLTRNGAGDEVRFAYDDLGRMVEMIDGNGNLYTYVYDDNDNLTDINGPLTYHQGFRFDANDNLEFEIDPLGGVISYTYDASEMLTSVQNQLGFTTVYTYNDMDKLAAMEDAEGRVWEFEYDAVYNLTAVHGPEGTHTLYEYDGVNNITLSTACNSDYDGTTCPEHFATKYEYDDLDRLIRLIENYEAGGPVDEETNVTTEFQYDIAGNLRILTDALGHQTFYGYSDRDELIRSEDAEEQVTRFIYDGNGLMVSLINARGYTTTFTYDGANRLETMRDADDNLWQYFYDHNGNLQEMIDPLDVITRYEYDELDRLSHLIQNYVAGGAATYDQNVTTRFEYDNAGNLRFVYDPRQAESYVTEHQYDAAHRRILTIDNEEGETSFGYDKVNNLVRITDANVHTTTFTLDDLDRQVAITNPEGHSVRFVYDRLGNLLTLTDARNNLTTFTYDGMNRVILMVDAMNGEWRYEYDAMGNVLCEEDANSHANDCYTYDKVYRVLSITDAEGHTDSFTYDENGNLLSWTDGNDHITTYTYDVLDRLENVTNAENETTTYRYDPLGNQTHLIEADGIVTRYVYDPLYWLVTVNQNDQPGQPESADVNVDTHYVYDEVGNLLTIIDAELRETHFTYDGMNRLLTEVDADNNLWQYGYDAVGNRTWRIDANGYRTDYTYYPDNQPETISYELDGTTVAYSYDPNNNRTEMVDHLGTTTWVYDPLNRVTEVNDAFGRVLGYGYDAVGNRTSLTYNDGRIVQYAYYDNNWLRTATDPESNVTHYERDGVGLVITTTNPNQTVSIASYDRANRLLTLENVQIGGAQTTNSTFSYTYNEVGHRTQMVAEYGWRNPAVVTSDYTYDGLRRLIRDEDSEGIWTDYTFDRVGNRLILNTNDDSLSPRPFDEKTIYYSYSDANRLLSLVGNTHPGSPGTKREDNVGQTIYAFRHEVAAQRGKHIHELAADNLLTMADALIAELEGHPTPDEAEVTAAIAAIRVQVQSDWAGGLITSDGIANSLLVKLNLGDSANNGANDEWQTQTFTYDANGNRINTEYPGPQGPRVQGTDYTYDPENRLIVNWDYQQNLQGNRVDRAITTMEYDGGGRRLAKAYDPKQGGGGEKRVEYVFDGWDPVSEYNLLNPQYENFYRGDMNRIITMHHFPSGTAGQMYWYHYDGLGSVAGLTKQLGQSHHNYRYEPYGQIEMPPGNFTDPHNHYTFTGQEWDENMGLYEFYARDYDPVTSTWLSQDSYRGETDIPSTLHRYQYVSNNPVSSYDLFGFLQCTINNQVTTSYSDCFDNNSYFDVSQDDEDINDQELEKLEDAIYKDLTKGDGASGSDIRNLLAYDTPFWNGYDNPDYRVCSAKHGRCDARSEVNYIGIGMYAAHERYSYDATLEMVYDWKKNAHGTTPTPEVIYWTKYGYYLYQNKYDPNFYDPTICRADSEFNKSLGFTTQFALHVLVPIYAELKGLDGARIRR